MWIWIMKYSQTVRWAALFSLQSTVCPASTIGPTYTAATYEMTAGGGLQADQTRRSCRSQYSCRSSCTRIRHPRAVHSFLTTGRCLCQMCWTSYHCCSWMNHDRRYLSIQTLAACSWTTQTVLRTNCTRRSTSGWCYVTVGQTSAYSGHAVSADWAGRCQASSCLSSHWNRL